MFFERLEMQKMLIINTGLWFIFHTICAYVLSIIANKFNFFTSGEVMIVYFMALAVRSNYNLIHMYTILFYFPNETIAAVKNYMNNLGDKK